MQFNDVHVIETILPFIEAVRLGVQKLLGVHVACRLLFLCSASVLPLFCLYPLLMSAMKKIAAQQSNCQHLMMMSF